MVGLDFVAFKNTVISPGLNRTDVEVFLSRVRDLIEVEEVHGIPWLGIDAIKARADQWLQYREQFKAAKAANPQAHHPSMFHFTSDGQERFQGVGSDSGRVRTFFAEDGTRQPWALKLTSGTESKIQQASWGSLEAVEALKDDRLRLNEDVAVGWVECSICGHRETWDPDTARGRGPARARMKRHCLTARKEVTMHRKLATEVFGS